MIDPALTARVEQAIARERSVFAEGMAAIWPASRATWLPVAQGRAIFTGPGYYSNRAFGLGVTGAVTAEDVEHIERFYAARDAHPQIEIASTVERSFIDLLARLDYRIVRFHNIYAQVLAPDRLPDPDTRPGIRVETVADDATAETWSTILLDGFGYAAAADRAHVARWNRMLRALPQLAAFVARVDGRAAGAASVVLLEDTAMLGGAATLPDRRRQGVQQALIEARLALAVRRGCTLAVVTADPGSSSGRNAERTGFHLVNTHVAMRKAR